MSAGIDSPEQAGKPGFLPDEDWARVVQHAPLVSIDLIVRRADNAVLLGRRRNEPAQGLWFVPGGVIRKGETLDEAYARIIRDELGWELVPPRAQARFMGVHEHFYARNFRGEPGYGTHYVVLAYALSGPEQVPQMGIQHSDQRWFSVETLHREPDVHPHAQAYFRGERR
ncbi:MAG TPA: NUDIX domain-containing protein [Solimonas sp.]|nr:NUDIX domain-containing protein [Solimonas sp.]